MGGYGQIEGRLAGNDTRHLDLWMRMGLANTRTNRIGTSFNLGATWGNDDSHIGLALAHARQSRQPAITAFSAVSWTAEACRNRG